MPVPVPYPNLADASSVPQELQRVLEGLTELFGEDLRITALDDESVTFCVDKLSAEVAFRTIEDEKADIFGFGPNLTMPSDPAAKAGACAWRMGQFQCMRPSDGDSTEEIYIRWLPTSDLQEEYMPGFWYW